MLLSVLYGIIQLTESQRLIFVVAKKQYVIIKQEEIV